MVRSLSQALLRGCRKGGRFVPGFEALEGRETPAVTASFSAATGLLLVAQRQPDCIALALGQGSAFELPGRPQLGRLGQPGRLGQAAGDGSLQDRRSHYFASLIIILVLPL